MTDVPDSNNGQDKAEETIFNSDIGDDWGEAFQAEDFMFAPDEDASSEFFLEDDSFSDTDSAEFADSSIHADDSFGEGKAANLAILDKLLGLPALVFALPLKLRIPVIALTVGLLIALFFAFQGSPEMPLPETPSQDDQNIATESGQDAAQTDTQPDTTQTATEQAPPADKSSLPEITDFTEKVRKRWKLPSFLISSFDEELKSTALLAVDVTFVLMLDKDAALPEDDELILRETIFQFFNNHSLADLKRFALSRGEMNRSLTSWIHKQLPDLPLSSIVFERYQLL